MFEFFKPKKFWVIVLLAFFFYLFVDIAIFSPKLYFPDEHTYLSIGKNFAETGNLKMGNGARAFVMPLPAVMYGLIYKIAGEDSATILISRLIQAIALLFTGIGILMMTHSIFKDKISSIASLIITLFYPSLVAYQAMLLSESLFIFFLVSGFAFLFYWQDTHKTWHFVLSVIFFSCSVYTRAVITFLTPVLVACALYSMKMDIRSKIKYILLSCLIFAVCLFPWWVRNYKIFGEFVPFTLANHNMYLGNNPANTTASISLDE
ncbi:MAG: hypothetical protein FWG09_07575, partial [Synergistaceae bacterium]|nr:hypothetical protein [Synergistaceae bacterium]